MARGTGEVAGFFLYSVAVAGLTGLIGIVTARLLGPSDRGALASVYTVATTVLAVCLVSLADALSFELRRNPGSHGGLAGAALALTTFFASVGAIATAVIVSALPMGQDVEVPLFVAAFVATSSLGTVSLATFIGLADFRTTNRLRLVGPVALVVFLGAAALAFSGSLGVRDVLACYFASELMAFVTISSQVASRVGLGRPVWANMSLLAKSGARLHPTSLLIIASANIDKFWIIAAATSHEIGIYFVGMTLASALIGAVGSAIFTVWLPRLQVLGDERRTDSFIYLLSIAFVALAIVAALGAAASPVLVPMLFGHDYVESIPVSALLFAGCFLLAMRQIVYRCIRAYEDFRTGGYAELAYLVVFAVLATALPIDSSLYRVVAAFMLASFASFAATLFLASRTLGISPAAIVSRMVAAMPAASADLGRRALSFASRSRN